MSEFSPLPIKATRFSLRNYFNALGQSPISVFRKNGPSLPQIANLGFGGSVTLRNGMTLKVEPYNEKLNPGDKVIVYTLGQKI